MMLFNVADHVSYSVYTDVRKRFYVLGFPFEFCVLGIVKFERSVLLN